MRLSSGNGRFGDALGRAALQADLSNEFCNECKIRVSELVCGCQTPWPKICKECSVAHLSKSSQTFHSVLPIKYLSSIKTLQDFQRFYSREMETNEVLHWLNSNFDSVIEAEKTLERFVSVSIEELMAWKQEWMKQLQAVREQITKDVEEIRGKIEVEYMTGAEVEKLRLLKERRPILLDFRLSDLSLSKALNSTTQLTLFSPALMQELGSASSPDLSEDLSFHGDTLSSLKAIIAVSKDVGRLVAAEDPITEIELPRDSVAAWTKQAEWVNSQAADRVCRFVTTIDSVCNLMLGEQAAAMRTCGVTEKLRIIQAAVAAGVTACRELPRSLRTKAREEELQQAVTAQSHISAGLAARVGELEGELNLHSGCHELRGVIAGLETRVQAAEEGKAQAELRLRDNLEQYCRGIIQQHREKVWAIANVVTREVANKSETDGKLINDLSSYANQQVSSAFQALSLKSSSSSLQSISQKSIEGQGLVKGVQQRLPIHENDPVAWSSLCTDWKQSIEKLRKDSASKSAMFLSNILDVVFERLAKMLQESDEQLMRSIGMLTHVIESENLKGISSWYEKCKSLIPKKKLAEYETILVCHSSFRDELNALIRSFSEQFGESLPRLEGIKTHCRDVFGPLTPGLVAEPIKAISLAGDTLLTKISGQSHSIVQTALIPVTATFNDISKSITVFLNQFPSQLETVGCSLQTQLTQAFQTAFASLQSTCHSLAFTVGEEMRQEVPDFPPGMNVVPLPVQTQTKMIDDLQTNLGRKCRDFDVLTSEHFEIRLRHYSAAIEDRWTHELRAMLGVWTSRSLLPHKKKTLCEKSLSRLRLSDLSPCPSLSHPADSPELTDKFSSPLEDTSEALSTLQSFQFFDRTLSVLYDESRKALLEAKEIEAYATLVMKQSRFSRQLARALPAMYRLYTYEQPQAVLFAKLFGLFGQQPLSPESCFVVNHHRQAFKALAFSTAPRTLQLSEQYQCSVCWEVPLTTILREYLLMLIHGSESIRVWTAWMAHLKPEKVSLGQFGWVLCDWLLRHFVSASLEDVWRLAGRTGELTLNSLHIALFESTDKLIPLSIVTEMLPQLLSKAEFLRAANCAAEVTEDALKVRGDMFLCGAVEAIRAMQEVAKDIQNSYRITSKPAGYVHPLLTSQVAFLPQRPKSILLE